MKSEELNPASLFPDLKPTTSPDPSSHRWLRTVWGYSQWCRHAVVPWWCSCRDTQYQVIVPGPQTQHSRAQTSHKTGQPPRRWQSLVQRQIGPLHQWVCTRRLPGFCSHPRPPGQGCSDELWDSQTPLWVPVANCQPASEQTVKHTNAAS